MQIRGAGAGSLTVWLVDIGCGVWGQIAALQLQHEQIRNVTLTMTNKTHLTKYRCSTECHYYFTCQRPAWSTELFIIFIIFIFTTFLNITNRIWPLFMQAGRVPSSHTTINQWKETVFQQQNRYTENTFKNTFTTLPTTTTYYLTIKHHTDKYRLYKQLK